MKKPQPKEKLQKIHLTYTFEDFIEYTILDKRTVILNGEINDFTSTVITKRLFFLASINKNPIKVILNSVGGEVYFGLLIFDTIRSIVGEGIEIDVEVRGLGASMAAIIVQAGSKRLGSKYSRFLIHEVSSILAGKTSEVEEQAEELKKVNNMLKQILAERCKKPSEEIERIWYKKDFWMSAEEALSFGLIDDVV